MKKKLAVWALIVAAVSAAVYVTEWRYSDDMRRHINTVNTELQSTQAQATATGLVASLESMTATADVGGEIISTHDHVHTLKDAYLAWKIKRAIQQSANVGAAIRNAIESWQENVAEQHEEGSAKVADFAAPATSPAPASVPPTPAGYWQVDHDTNAVTDVVTTTASLRYRDKQNIYIRQRGKRPPDCYIDTGDFLETVDNMHSRMSTVQYRIDDGKLVRQGWVLSDDNTALFYPGSCGPLIAKLRSAKRLAFEYKPAERIESTISFEVEGLPDVFKINDK